MSSLTLNTPRPQVGAPAPGGPRHRRILTAAFIGTTVEYYDFYLYATAAALVFGSEFFPGASPAVGLIASFATYGVGFVARPIGGVIAGHLGDRIGRKGLLVASLLLMGIASTAIGLLPGYDTIGIAAVVGLVLLRLLQGVAAGAEWGGSALLSVEHAQPRNRGLYGAFTQMGSAGGLLLATGVFYAVRDLVGEDAFLAGAWRIPFLLSAILVAVGLVIRLRLEDAPEFLEVREQGRTQRLPVATVLRHHTRGVLVTAGLRLVQPALFSILTTYILTYLLDHRGDSGPGLQAILVVSALSLLSTPFWGWVSDRVGRRQLAIASALGMAVFIWPFFAFLDSGPLLLLPLVVGIGMNLLHDAIYGPQAAWFAEQFPTEVRYTGVSLGYQLGSIVSVGLTPLLAVWFVQIGDGSPWLLCLYLDVFAALSILAAVVARDGAAERLQAAGPRATGR